MQHQAWAAIAIINLHFRKCGALPDVWQVLNSISRGWLLAAPYSHDLAVHLPVTLKRS